MGDTPPSLPPTGQTVREIARRYRVAPAKVRGWITSGRLGAISTADSRCSRPRYIVLPHHLAEFEKSRSAAQPPKPTRRRRQRPKVDYYPDDA
jgi:hypothetical protein